MTPLQDLIRTSLADLQNVNARVLDLSLFSPNETLEDITTPDLVYLFVPYVIAEVLGRVKALERDDRMRLLQQAEVRPQPMKWVIDTDIPQVKAKDVHLYLGTL